MQSVIEQATQALQRRRFADAKTLASAALATTDRPAARLPLLEMLAQAQAGLQEYEAAARSWHEAYQYATTYEDRARLFAQARQALQEQHDYTALWHLAHDHLAHVRTPQEQAACLLTAGTALMHLQRYQEARRQYLAPALEIPGAAPETRLQLWHYLGLSHLAEHRFTEAAAAFRQSADLALGQHFTNTAAHLAASRAQWHHVRNAARFYEGVIHLVYHQPHQAVQALQALQRPLTAVGASNVALFLGLAYRALQQPENATRALQSLARPATCPEALRGPAAVVRMGIAAIQEAPATVGEHLEAALDAPLEPRMAWEPSWRVLLYGELGLILHRLGCRDAAIACYEDGLKLVVHRFGAGEGAALSAALQGAALLTALAQFPLETWSALAQGELRQLLQRLAWLYAQDQDSGLAETAFVLALRLVSTPEQELSLWCQRAWCLLMATAFASGAGTESHPCRAEVLAGLQQAQTHCTARTLAGVGRGLAALLQGDEAQASAACAEIPVIPEAPELQAVCVAAWLWAHTRHHTLEGALTQSTVSASPPWVTSTVLALALETLLSWRATAPDPSLPWLTALLLHQPEPTLEALRLLCRPGYLAAPQHTTLMAALTRLATNAEHPALADQVAALLGGQVLVERIEVLLAALDQSLAAPLRMPPAGTRPQKQRRGPHPADSIATATARVLQLLQRVHHRTPAWHHRAQGPERSLAAVICDWLLRYGQICTHAPEVVGTLLGLLRQCPGATAVIPTILEQVALSRRQRQALAAALQAPPELPTASSPWEALQHCSVGRLLDTLADVHRPSGAALDAARPTPGWHIAALVLARVGLRQRAVACLQACLRQQPEDPYTHAALAQLLAAQHQPEAALQHALQAWHALQARQASPTLWHLEILNQLLMLLDATGQYARFPAWLERFDQVCAALRHTTLAPAHHQRRREAEGVCALWRASYLAAVSSSAPGGTNSTVAQQLAYLEQAVAQSPSPIQQVARHRQAELCTRLYRYAAAIAIYNDLVQQWPDDQRARQRLDVLIALQRPASESAQTDRVLAEALSAAFIDVCTPPAPSPLTPHSALAWLHEAPRQTPNVLDVIDTLTAYGAVAIQRQAWQSALAMLLPLYAMSAQPRQAYYLALAYYEQSRHAASAASALRDSSTAWRYVQAALTADPTMAEATRLRQALEAHNHTLLTARRQEDIRAAYRQRVTSLLAHYGVRVQAHPVARAPEAAWVVLQEVADLDEASGKPVTTVHAFFNSQATRTPAWPDEAALTLYAQHQRDKQRVLDTNGIAALPWPRTAYEGATDFAALFPERLGLNRDILFIAFADLHALLRYARVLPSILQGFLVPELAGTPLSAGLLAAIARYLTLIPLVRQRLHTLAAAAASKVVQRQISSGCDVLTAACTPEQWQHLPPFADAYSYFRGIADTMRGHLDTPPAERLEGQSEERQPQRQARRQRRQVKNRWKTSEVGRRRERSYSEPS